MTGHRQLKKYCVLDFLENDQRQEEFYKMQCSHIVPRPGSCIVFIRPSSEPAMLVGMVLTVWKGQKHPRMFAGEVPISCVSAMRVVELQLSSKDLGY